MCALEREMMESGPTLFNKLKENLILVKVTMVYCLSFGQQRQYTAALLENVPEIIQDSDPPIRNTKTSWMWPYHNRDLFFTPISTKMVQPKPSLKLRDANAQSSFISIDDNDSKINEMVVE